MVIPAFYYKQKRKYGRMNILKNAIYIGKVVLNCSVPDTPPSRLVFHRGPYTKKGNNLRYLIQIDSAPFFQTVVTY